MNIQQREQLASLQTAVDELRRHLGRIQRNMHRLAKLTSFSEMDTDPDYTVAEIEGLLRFNRRLITVEAQLRTLAETQNSWLRAQVADNRTILDDYEIDATLYFILRTDDPEFDEDDDNFLTQRHFSLKQLEPDHPLADGQDHRNPLRSYPEPLRQVALCWFFHDLISYDYGLEQPKLSLRDCLRIDSIWIDVAVRHQATLIIETGGWENLMTEAE
jgi:hypothetical protein